jgi:hypothetical protein
LIVEEPPDEVELEPVDAGVLDLELELELELLLLDPHAATPSAAAAARATALMRLLLTSSPSLVVPRSVCRSGPTGVNRL